MTDSLDDKYMETLKRIQEIEERLTQVEKMAQGIYLREGRRLRSEDKLDYPL